MGTVVIALAAQDWSGCIEHGEHAPQVMLDAYPRIGVPEDVGFAVSDLQGRWRAWIRVGVFDHLVEGVALSDALECAVISALDAGQAYSAVSFCRIVAASSFQT